MTEIFHVDGRETGIDGLYSKQIDTIFINAYLDDIDKKKVLYHELGHVGQYLENYQRLREKFEAQANRKMLKGLLRDYLRELDDPEQFNISRFMEYYRLNSIRDEIIIYDEFKKMI